MINVCVCTTEWPAVRAERSPEARAVVETLVQPVRVYPKTHRGTGNGNPPAFRVAWRSGKHSLDLSHDLPTGLLRLEPAPKLYSGPSRPRAGRSSRRTPITTLPCREGWI